MKVVEHVARALCIEDRQYPDMMMGLGPDDAVPRWRGYLGRARVAIAAMRIPSEGMIVVGVRIGSDDSADIYSAMIDAALSE